MVPQYRHLLPIFANFFRNPKQNLGVEIEACLHVMEKFGGREAFGVIKSYIPTYQSIV
jgi:hypothetical protein